MAEEVAGAPLRRGADDVADLLPLLTDPDRESFSSGLLEPRSRARPTLRRPK